MIRRLPCSLVASLGQATACSCRPSPGQIPKLKVVTGLVLLSFSPLLPACHQGSPPPADPMETTPASGVKTNTAPASKDTRPKSVPAPVSEVDARRWLIVQKVRDGEPGAWATGAFHPQRNKIEIKTHGAKAFSIDTNRIGINWERLVILSIDGVSSELRKRDFEVYPFVRDSHGRWVVVE